MTAKNRAYYVELGKAAAINGSEMFKPKSGWQLAAWEEGFKATEGKTFMAQAGAAVTSDKKLVTTLAYGHPQAGNKSFERAMRRMTALVSKITHRQRLYALCV